MGSTSLTEKRILIIGLIIFYNLDVLSSEDTQRKYINVQLFGVLIQQSNDEDDSIKYERWKKIRDAFFFV